MASTCQTGLTLGTNLVIWTIGVSPKTNLENDLALSGAPGENVGIKTHGCYRPKMSFDWHKRHPKIIYPFQNSIACNFLLIDICSHEENHFNQKKTSGVRWLWVAQVGGRVFGKMMLQTSNGLTGGVGLVHFIGILVYLSVSIAILHVLWIILYHCIQMFCDRWGSELPAFFWRGSRKC